MGRSNAPRWLNVTTLALIPLAALYAWYRGFRMPSIWSVTLLNVSITDGFHRRFLVGTLLSPFGNALHDDYWFFAAFAFAVLAALLITICVLAVRTRLVSQRALVIIWLVFGAGGYLFNEVGYLDQVLYLLLFAALWCIHRSKLAAASVLLIAAVLTHEIALFTILPIVLVAFGDIDLQQTLKVLAPPVLVNVVIVMIPAASSGAVGRLENTLIRNANYFPRVDALALFDRSQVDNWSLYSPWDVFRFLAPLAVASAVAILLVHRFRTCSHANSPTRWFRDRRVLACVAVGSPLLLAVGGWDKYRWGFLLLSNFFIVLWIWIGDTGRELNLRQGLTVVVALLIMMQWGYLHYFDGYNARELDSQAIRNFSRHLGNGSLFKVPDDGAFFLHLPSPHTK